MRIKLLPKLTYLIGAILFVTAFIVSPFQTASAVPEECDLSLYSLNDIPPFYDPCSLISTNSCSTSTTNSVFNNSDYAGNKIFSDAHLQAIDENRPFYESAATKEGIPWQLIAAVHARETGLKRYGPSNGYGPYQITPSEYPISSTYTDGQFQFATDKAAAFLKARMQGSPTDANTIKDVLFAYNGKAAVYVQQAKSLGFSDVEASVGEGSPYVMNRADLKRDPTADPTKTNRTWGQIKADYGSISYPANTDYGAFVYYIALTNGSLCGASPSAANGDASAVQAAFTSYMNSNANRYGSYTLGVNGCTTLSRWYIGEYTTLAYGNGNGEAVVDNLVSKNSDKGLVVSNKPVAPSVFSVQGGLKTWGASGVSAGHVGIVVSVDEATQTATVVHTGSSKAGEKDKAWVSTFSYPVSGVTFTYIGDNLK